MRILITAGPTREHFDSVRFISNPSSGKMGYALARAARDRGHTVVLVSGPVALNPPKGVEFVPVESAVDMARECKAAFAACNAAIMTAAVCDYRPSRRTAHKLQKQARPKRIILEPTEDIISTLGRRKSKRILIGFAMEDHDHRAHAESKLRRKRCDAIILNGPENVGSDRAFIEILTADGTWSGPISGTKQKIARHVIRLAEQLAE